MFNFMSTIIASRMSSSKRNSVQLQTHRQKLKKNVSSERERQVINEPGLNENIVVRELGDNITFLDGLE